MSSAPIVAPGPAPSYSHSDAQDTLVAQHMSQVRRIARGIARRLPRHVAFDDLVQAGMVGLIDALQKFEAGKHVQFSTYANFRIHGAILDSLRELDWAPRELRKRARRLEQADQRLHARLGRAPEEDEVAREMRMNVADLRGLRAERDHLEIASLDSRLPGDESADLASQLRDSAATPYEECRRAEIKRLLIGAINSMPRRERDVLALYYFEELTMKEVGRVLGVDESRISQIHSAATARLSALIGEQFDESTFRP